MGWWQRGGWVIGDPVVDYIEEFGKAAGPESWAVVADIPRGVREHLDRLYMDGVNRSPTEADLRALLGYCSASP